jgi:hypothetical protein
MKHLSANRKNTSKLLYHNEMFEPEILADSLEVMENYCAEKIVLLQSSLEKLNVADNACEIISICQQIRKERDRLHDIIKRKRRL